MTERQLQFLKQFKKEGITALGKTSPSELHDLVRELKSLSIIATKQTSPTLEITDLLSFEKLIEIESLKDFKKWYSEKDKSIVNNFNNSTIGQVNQKTEFSRSRNDVKVGTNDKKEKKSQLKKVLSNRWLIGILLTVLAAILNSDRIIDFINELINKV